jgi:hypothetical protein
MASAASAATAKSLKAHCTQADGSKPPPDPGEHKEPKIEAITPPSRLLRHSSRSSSHNSSNRGGSGRGGTRERFTKDGAPLSLSASLALTKKKRDEANKKAKDREAYYDALGSDEDDEIMKEMMDLSDSDDEEDKPVTQKKRKHKNRYSPLSDEEDDEDSDTAYTTDSSITNSTDLAKNTYPLSILNKKSPAKKGKKFIAFSANADKEQQEWQSTKLTPSPTKHNNNPDKTNKDTNHQTAPQHKTDDQTTAPHLTQTHITTSANSSSTHPQKTKQKSNQTTMKSFIKTTPHQHRNFFPPSPEPALNTHTHANSPTESNDRTNETPVTQSVSNSPEPALPSSALQAALPSPTNAPPKHTIAPARTITPAPPQHSPPDTDRTNKTPIPQPVSNLPAPALPSSELPAAPPSPTNAPSKYTIAPTRTTKPATPPQHSTTNADYTNETLITQSVSNSPAPALPPSALPAALPPPTIAPLKTTIASAPTTETATPPQHKPTTHTSKTTTPPRDNTTPTHPVRHHPRPTPT